MLYEFLKNFKICVRKNNVVTYIIFMMNANERVSFPSTYVPIGDGTLLTWACSCHSECSLNRFIRLIRIQAAYALVRQIREESDMRATGSTLIRCTQRCTHTPAVGSYQDWAAHVSDNVPPYVAYMQTLNTMVTALCVSTWQSLKSYFNIGSH